jgi:hypothetical protein
MRAQQSVSRLKIVESAAHQHQPERLMRQHYGCVRNNCRISAGMAGKRQCFSGPFCRKLQTPCSPWLGAPLWGGGSWGYGSLGCWGPFFRSQHRRQHRLREPRRHSDAPRFRRRDQPLELGGPVDQRRAPLYKRRRRSDGEETHSGLAPRLLTMRMTVATARQTTMQMRQMTTTSALRHGTLRSAGDASNAPVLHPGDPDGGARRDGDAFKHFLWP